MIAPATRTVLVGCLGLVLSLCAPAGAGASGQWRWPATGSHRVVNPYRPPAHDWLPGHRGVDLGVGSSRVVYAVGVGRVSFVGQIAQRSVIVIAHAGNLRTTYEPVTATVRLGQRVAAGQRIGMLQRNGSHCRPSCLHLGLKRGTTYLNPLLLFAPTRARLLPHLGH